MDLPPGLGGTWELEAKVKHFDYETVIRKQTFSA